MHSTSKHFTVAPYPQQDPINGGFTSQQDTEASHIGAIQDQSAVTSPPMASSPIESSSTQGEGPRATNAVNLAALEASGEATESSSGKPRLANHGENLEQYRPKTQLPLSRTLEIDVPTSSPVARTGGVSPAGQRVKEFDRLSEVQESIPFNGSGAPRLPTRDDFPPSISSIIVPRVTEKPVEHVVVLLHDFGGNEETLETFAFRLRERQPETAFVLLRGLESVPTGNSGHNWADSHSDWDGGFSGVGRKILIDVIKTGLIVKCGFEPRGIVFLGHGQGGMAALATVAACHRLEFGGVITIGGPMPAYAQLPYNVKARTPALLLRRELGDINGCALQHLRDSFMSLDISTQPGVHDTIPEQQKEIEPLLDFFAHRLGREEWTKQAILSFDGGGIRGYGSLLILQDLMNKIGDEERRQDREDGPADSSFAPCVYKPTTSMPTNKSNEGHERMLSRTSVASSSSQAKIVPTATEGLPNSALYLPCHYFTYAAGTSTGGLISIMLSRFRMTVDDCIAEYKTLGEKIFGHPRPFAKWGIIWHKFNYRTLEAVIKDVTSRHCEEVEYNTDYPMDEDLCRSIVLAYADQLKSGVPYLFRTYRNPPPTLIPTKSKLRQRTLRNHGEAAKLPIWQVARATSAAPNYFPPIKIERSSGRDPGVIKFKDGGFGSNNPSDEAYHDVLYKHGGIGKNIGPFISIGTGIPPYELFAKKEGNLNNTIANFKAASKLPSRTLKVHEIMDGLATRDQEEIFPYYRFDGGPRLGEVELDEWKSHKFTRLTGKSTQPGHKTLDKMYLATAAYLQRRDVQNDLTECANLLVKRRRLRTRNYSAWERYASASYYICVHNGCEKVRIDTRQLFKEHLKERHHIQVADEVLEKTILDSRHCWIYQKGALLSDASRLPSAPVTASGALHGG